MSVARLQSLPMLAAGELAAGSPLHVVLSPAPPWLYLYLAIILANFDLWGVAEKRRKKKKEKKEKERKKKVFTL